MCAGLRLPTAWLDLTALGRKDTSRTSPVTGDTRNIIANTANNARNVKIWLDGKNGANPWTGGQSACSRDAMTAAGQSGRQEAALGRGEMRRGSAWQQTPVNCIALVAMDSHAARGNEAVVIVTTQTEAVGAVTVPTGRRRFQQLFNSLARQRPRLRLLC